MLNTGNWKQKLSFMALGSIFTIIGVIFAIGMLASDKAQRGAFEAIQCSRLEIVDADGETRIILRIDEHGGKIGVTGKGEGKAVMAINEYGNRAVYSWDKNGNLQ